MNFDIKQLQKILLLQRLVVYLFVLKYLNRVKEITDALDKKTSFTYDANGNLLTVTDAKNQVITYTYNVRDKVATMIDQLGKVETYSYDKNDNLVSLKDRKNQVASYTRGGPRNSDSRIRCKIYDQMKEGSPV